MPYVPKTDPFPFQADILEQTRDLQAFALFWEMGVGKTKPTIDTIGHLYAEGKIDAALILAPKAVAPNWVHDELPAHMGTTRDVHTFLWDTKKAKNKGFQRDLAEFLRADGLQLLVMSYPAIMTQRKKGAARGLMKGKEAAKKLLTSRRCMFVLDESARIKGPDTKRTKRVLAAGLHAPYRRIMTGTPVPNSPFDVYTQLKFLDPDVWKKLGCDSFAAFKSMFGVWIEHERKDNGQRFETLVDYQNLAVLNKVVDRMGSRLLKDDVLDLPPKQYEKRTFDLSPKQRVLYEQLKKEFIVWLDGGDTITAPLAITRMLRLQQVTSGYLPTDGGDEVLIDDNPRLLCLNDLMDDIPHQAIVWGKFQKDIDLIAELLTERDETFVVFDGRVNQTEREIRRAMFKAGDAKYFVANPAAAGEGLTLHMAKTVVYYNSTYNLGDRLQSEDRAHRAGMDDRPVLYLDIIARASIDVQIIRALRTKSNLAAQVTGDAVRNWI